MHTTNKMLLQTATLNDVPCATCMMTVPAAGADHVMPRTALWRMTHPPHIADKATKGCGQLPFHPKGVGGVDVGFIPATEEHRQERDAVHQALQATVHETGVAKVLQPYQPGVSL
jgi:hypothetical protein